VFIAAIVGAVFFVGIFIGMGSSAAPNPGHSWTQIGDLPIPLSALSTILVTTPTAQTVDLGKGKITNLNADLLDSIDSSAFCQGSGTNCGSLCRSDGTNCQDYCLGSDSGSDCPEFQIVDGVAPGGYSEAGTVPPDTTQIFYSACPGIDYMAIMCEWGYSKASGSDPAPKTMQVQRYPFDVGGHPNLPNGCKITVQSTVSTSFTAGVNAVCMKVPHWTE